jgi:hypothetical protein
MKRQPEKADDLLTKLLGAKWPMAPDTQGEPVDIDDWLENLSDEDRQKMIDGLIAQSKERS